MNISRKSFHKYIVENLQYLVCLHLCSTHISIQISSCSTTTIIDSFIAKIGNKKKIKTKRFPPHCSNTLSLGILAKGAHHNITVVSAAVKHILSRFYYNVFLHVLRVTASCRPGDQTTPPLPHDYLCHTLRFGHCCPWPIDTGSLTEYKPTGLFTVTLLFGRCYDGEFVYQLYQQVNKTVLAKNVL